jgi:pyrroline-5-carboxylate reductase
MSTERIGILGAGRLGRALSARLRESCEVAVYDVDARKGKQFAKQHGLAFLYEEDLLGFADLLLLCVPATAVEDFFRRLDRGRSRHPVYLNLATDLDTPALVRAQGLNGLKVIGLKPIGQFVAIQHRLPTVFVTAHADAGDLDRLAAVFREVGVVQEGDEGKVRAINGRATELALRFCRGFEETLLPLAGDNAWARSALRNVAVGTILDYPPDEDNDYTRRILREISA